MEIIAIYLICCTCVYYFYRRYDNLDHNWRDIIIRFILSFFPIINVIVFIIAIWVLIEDFIREKIKLPKPPKWL